MNERELRIRIKNDLPFFAHNFLKIRTKDEGVIPLKFSKSQSYIHEKIQEQKKEKGYVKAIVTKGRQGYCSTYIGARYFSDVIHNKGIRAFILTHRADATDNLFSMTQRFYQYLPDKLKPFVDRKSRKELSFPLLDSGYKVGTAGAPDVGRSDTIQRFHWSECGLCENTDDIISGVMQAVPPKNSELIIESTARGMGNYFHQQWIMAEKGESDFIPIFLPFYWQDEYTCELDEKFSLSDEDIEIRDMYKLTNEQMYWRQKKITEIGSELFKQEYPLNPQEAFSASFHCSFIPNILVEKARKCVDVKPYGQVIIGVDPSRNDGSGDRTSIICRQGRVAFDLKSFRTSDTMEIVGIIHRMIKQYEPRAVCIDVIGIGSGIVDRLRELGFEKIVKPINCTNVAYNSDKYKDKKAEMWGTFKDWLEDYPCKIPDVDSLHTDICCVGFGYDSKDRIKMQSKDEIKKNGFASPDEAEALVNTFGLPFHVGINQSVQPYSLIENIW